MKNTSGRKACPYPLCTVILPDRLFACLPHWMILPQGVRIMITNTRHLQITTKARVDAIQDAIDAWDARLSANLIEIMDGERACTE